MNKPFFIFLALSSILSNTSFGDTSRQNTLRSYHCNCIEKTYCWKTSGDTTPWLDHIHAKGIDSPYDSNPPVVASSREDAEYQLLSLNQPGNVRAGLYVTCQMMIENVSCALIR